MPQVIKSYVFDTVPVLANGAEVGRRARYTLELACGHKVVSYRQPAVGYRGSVACEACSSLGVLVAAHG